MTKWMIHRDEYETATRAYARAEQLSILSRTELLLELDVNEAHVAEVDGRMKLAHDLEVRDGVAVIPIQGVLLDEPSFIHELFGIPHAAYSVITGLVHQADGNPDVSSIRFEVDSPGGLVTGVFDCADAILDAAKPTQAVVSNTCASAAYLLASQAGSITATGRADEIGSIGVATARFVDDQVVQIASTDAPNKRPDVRTAEGIAAVRKELDALHDLFVDAITRSRDVSDDDVRERFGRGGVLLAAAAQSAGMIDQLLDTGGQDSQPRAILACMDIDTLEREHRAVYDAVVALGETKERARVLRHLKFGATAGAPDVAQKHIAEGSACDGDAAFDYQEAALASKISGDRVNANAPDLGATQAGTDKPDPHLAAIQSAVAARGIKA